MIKRVDNPKKKLILELKKKIPIAADIYDFLFKPNQKLKFKPGQFLGLVLDNGDQDAKGVKRYFSIASSPTEADIRIGIKFYSNANSLTRLMLFLKSGDKIGVAQLDGDFVLPKDKNAKLVFIAGGIGITPFRSMIKYLLDTKERRDIVLLYSNYAPADIVYKDVFDQGERQLGIKTIYTVTDTPYPDDWRGERGFIDEKMIMRTIPDYKERTFYLSGSQAMVVAFEQILRKMGVKKWQIKKDFFPGSS